MPSNGGLICKPAKPDSHTKRKIPALQDSSYGMSLLTNCDSRMVLIIACAPQSLVTFITLTILVVAFLDSSKCGPGDPDSRKPPFSDSDIRQGSILACNIGLAYTAITVHV